MTTTEAITAPATFADLTPHTVAIENGMRSIMDGVVEIARHLTAARALVGYGRYQAWVNECLPFGIDTAERILNAAKTYTDYPELANLPQTTAALLGNAPVSAITEVVDLTQQGVKLSVNQCRILITAHKAAVKAAIAYDVHDHQVIALLGKIAQTQPALMDEIILTGCIQPGDERDAVPITATVAKLEKALSVAKRAQNSTFLDSMDNYSLYTTYTPNRGWVIAGFDSEQDAASFILRDKRRK